MLGTDDEMLQYLPGLIDELNKLGHSAEVSLVPVIGYGRF